MFSAAHYNKYIISQLCGFHCIYACIPGQADLLHCTQMDTDLNKTEHLWDVVDSKCVMFLLSHILGLNPPASWDLSGNFPHSPLPVWVLRSLLPQSMLG